MRLSCSAPAKLNLFLHVTGRRPDGYHLLQTLFRFVDLQDKLDFTLREDGQVLHFNPIPGVPLESDLCVRAARLLQQETGCRLGVEIRLEKNIPMGGGLGGGSSDAATTLIALNRLWSLGLSRTRLMELGLRLGADVPVFVFGQNAFAEGVGEQLQPFDLPDAWYLILFPAVHVPTPEIFAHPLLTRNTPSMKMRALSTGNVDLHNDLQPIACLLYPEVQWHIDKLSLHAKAKMTGSGACVFAEFAEQQAAMQVMQQLPSGIKGVVVRGLKAHPLSEWLSDKK